VRIFISNGSGNKEIENSQQRIQMVLTTRAIEFVTIDISAPGMHEMRSFMREKAKKREGQRNVLPPQIFNGKEHRGDYDGFDIANEDDDLEEFLGIPRKNPKFEPVKTGAVALDVGRLDPGKLAKDKIEVEEKSNEKEYKNEVSPIKLAATLEDDIDFGEGNTEVDETESETSDSYECEFKNWTQAVEEEALLNAANHMLEKTDGFNSQVKDIAMKVDNKKVFEIIDDSSDESSDDDTAVEYMPDGELVRKKSRGFKQLSNCKRFWKASLMAE